MASGCKSDTKAIELWLISNLDDDDFDTAYRYNSGDPALFVDIYDRDAATLFRLAWIEDND